MTLNSPVKIWRKQKEVASLLGRRGKIISYTIIHVPLLGFERQTPYVVAVVSLQDRNLAKRNLEERMTGQLVDWRKEDLRIGREVETVFRRTKEADIEGVISYGLKFRPY